MPNELLVRANTDQHSHTFASQHLAWMLQALPDVASERPLGDGSERAPYRMSTIGQWMGAAVIKLMPWAPSGGVLDAKEIIVLSGSRGADRGLYIIGGRLLERTPEGVYSNYITDVLDGGKAQVDAQRPRPDFTGTTALGRPRGFASPSRQDKPVYDLKFERLQADAAAIGKTLIDPGNNADMARQARALLKGETQMTIAPSDELPGTLAALFLAEVSREPRMLIITLMLLDLIEARHGSFTWSSLMTESGELAGGVRHPMVHHGAQSQAREMFNTFNDVTKRAVSILASWLTARLARPGSGWIVTAQDGLVGRGSLPQKLKQVTGAIGLKPESETSKSGVLWRFYNEAALPAITERARSLDFML